MSFCCDGNQVVNHMMNDKKCANVIDRSQTFTVTDVKSSVTPHLAPYLTKTVHFSHSKPLLFFNPVPHNPMCGSTVLCTIKTHLTMYKIFLSALIMGLVAQTALAQSPPKPESNDPGAKALLDKVRKKYEGYKTIEAAFALTIELPGQPKEVQRGTISQDGNKFRLDMTDQVIVSDGQSTWIYLKKNNEVQINKADPGDMSESGFMTPKDLLKRYEKGDFIYSTVDPTTENGKSVTNIEFKPKDKKSEFSKLRLAIEEKTLTIVSIKAFAKDGSRYTFGISKLSPNKKFASGHFTFDVKKYPGVKVEDLRM
jgi:outer membrane lipoprotein carrier protein